MAQGILEGRQALVKPRGRNEGVNDKTRLLEAANVFEVTRHFESRKSLPAYFGVPMRWYRE